MLIAVVVMAFIANCYGQSNHQFWGNVGYNDTMVYYNHIVKPSKILQTVEVDIVYPPEVSLNIIAVNMDFVIINIQNVFFFFLILCLIAGCH